ncbi:MAG TPA: DUF3341 domain-containing protein [Tepidisphaeraceae bacterium]|jgi:hypothetical protein
MEATSNIYGLMAEFGSPQDLLVATRKTRDEGYLRIDAFSPFPVEGLTEALRDRHTHVPLIVLIGGIAGGLGGFFMQWYANVVSYPWNIGGRPPNSWPAWIPITFEMTILFAGFAAVLGMLGLNGLPQPYHPVFNVPNFQLASRDRFFLLVMAIDPKFDLVGTRTFLEQFKPLSIAEVAP